MNAVCRVVLMVVLTSWVGAASLQAQDAPESLLQQINDAMRELNYEGTIVRSADGQLATLHVTHRFQDGISREKLVTMDGERREFLRTGDELICLLPQQRMKFVDRTAGASNAFTRLPSVTENIGLYYDLVALGTDRVAGRKALRYFIRPKDTFRYGHSLWVDAETLLPLRMQLLNANKKIEEIRFTDVEIGGEIAETDLQSSIDDTDFEVSYADSGDMTRPRVSEVSDIATTTDTKPKPMLPGMSGFTLRGGQSRMVQVNGHTVQRFEFSDGIATISMFVATGSGEARSAHGKIGATNTVQRSVGNATLTLVGEVPMSTLTMLAEQAEKQLTIIGPGATVSTE